MPECLNVTNWRTATRQEVLDWIDIDRIRPKGRRQFLVVRNHLRPVDIYCYLVARFGEPNGFQNFLRRDDSNNWIHWDFNVKAGPVDVYLAGTSREIHIMIDEALTDDDWKNLILSIKADYARVSREKSAVFKRLEKYVTFQNKYVSLAGLCAELHADIVDAPPHEPIPRNLAAHGEDRDALEQIMKRISKRADSLYGNCLKLRLLTPIMAEAYINMIILTFCRSEIRDDSVAYQRFIRAKIPERLALLSKNCAAFSRAIDKRTEAYAGFMRVIDKRNFALHGDVNPIKDQIEVVYFDKRRPLFTAPGNHIEKFFQQLDEIAEPEVVVKEYEQVHMFLLEIRECLEPQARAFADQVINDAYPGFEVHKRRPTRILPDAVVAGFMAGLRYDDDLNW